MRDKPIKTTVIYGVYKDREPVSYHKHWRDALTMRDTFADNDPEGNYHVVPRTMSESVVR